MSPSPFILREISGVDPSVSVKGTLGRPPPAVSGDSSSPCGRTSRPGGTELCSESLTAVAFLFALHSVADEGTGERIHNTVTSPDRADHDAHRERGAKITTDTDTAAPSLVQVRERGNARYLPSFAPDPILLSRPFVVSSSEYARPTNVTPTLNGDHRQRATDDGRTERAGGTGSRAHALY